MTRDESKACALDTLECITLGQYEKDSTTYFLKGLIKQMKERTILYRDEELFITRPKESKHPQILFSNNTTTSTLKRLCDATRGKHYKVCALNFASATHPGGGFLRGALAQEESIARVSTLYPSLLQCPDFYQHNAQSKTNLYTDYVIYSEGVTVFKDDNGEFLSDPFTVDIITSPAPNAKRVEEFEPFNIPRIYTTLKKRIEKIIKVAVLKNVDCLILGAFGCGVFGNSKPLL